MSMQNKILIAVFITVVLGGGIAAVVKTMDNGSGESRRSSYANEQNLESATLGNLSFKYLSDWDIEKTNNSIFLVKYPRLGDDDYSEHGYQYISESVSVRKCNLKTSSCQEKLDLLKEERNTFQEHYSSMGTELSNLKLTTHQSFSYVLLDMAARVTSVIIKDGTVYQITFDFGEYKEQNKALLIILDSLHFSQ